MTIEISSSGNDSEPDEAGDSTSESEDTDSDEEIRRALSHPSEKTLRAFALNFVAFSVFAFVSLILSTQYYWDDHVMRRTFGASVLELLWVRTGLTAAVAVETGRLWWRKDLSRVCLPCCCAACACRAVSCVQPLLVSDWCVSCWLAVPLATALPYLRFGPVFNCFVLASLVNGYGMLFQLAFARRMSRLASLPASMLRRSYNLVKKGGGGDRAYALRKKRDGGASALAKGSRTRKASRVRSTGTKSQHGGRSFEEVYEDNDDEVQVMLRPLEPRPAAVIEPSEFEQLWGALKHSEVCDVHFTTDGTTPRSAHVCHTLTDCGFHLVAHGPERIFFAGRERPADADVDTLDSYRAGYATSRSGRTSTLPPALLLGEIRLNKATISADLRCDSAGNKIRLYADLIERAMRGRHRVVKAERYGV